MIDTQYQGWCLHLTRCLEVHEHAMRIGKFCIGMLEGLQVVSQKIKTETYAVWGRESLVLTLSSHFVPVVGPSIKR